jgi:hypothetical protein
MAESPACDRIAACLETELRKHPPDKRSEGHLVAYEQPLSKRWESEMPVQTGFDHVSATKSNSTRGIATHPCKKRKMVQAHWEPCKYGVGE